MQPGSSATHLSKFIEEVSSFAAQGIINYDFFNRSDDPFGLKKHSKTNLLHWSTVMKIHENVLTNYSENCFLNKIQNESFTEKSKIMFLFKFLTYLMKYTFNHELYVIDNRLSNFLYSSDIDVVYSSFLFYNEYVDSENILRNMRMAKHLSIIDLKIFELKHSILNEKKKDNIDFNPVAAKDYSEETLFFYHQIYLYEFYFKKESNKIISIEILAGCLSIKLGRKTNIEILLFWIVLSNLSLSDTHLCTCLEIFFKLIGNCMELQILIEYFANNFQKYNISSHTVNNYLKNNKGFILNIEIQSDFVLMFICASVFLNSKKLCFNQIYLIVDTLNKLVFFDPILKIPAFKYSKILENLHYRNLIVLNGYMLIKECIYKKMESSINNESRHNLIVNFLYTKCFDLTLLCTNLSSDILENIIKIMLEVGLKYENQDLKVRYLKDTLKFYRKNKITLQINTLYNIVSIINIYRENSMKIKIYHILNAVIIIYFRNIEIAYIWEYFNDILSLLATNLNNLLESNEECMDFKVDFIIKCIFENIEYRKKDIEDFRQMSENFSISITRFKFQNLFISADYHQAIDCFWYNEIHLWHFLRLVYIISSQKNIKFISVSKLYSLLVSKPNNLFFSNNIHIIWEISINFMKNFDVDLFREIFLSSLSDELKMFEMVQADKRSIVFFNHLGYFISFLCFYESKKDYFIIEENFKDSNINKKLLSVFEEAQKIIRHMDYTIENTEIFLNSTHYDFVLNETNCISKNDKLENCLIEQNMIPRMCEIINKIFEKYITLHDLQLNQIKDFQDVMNSIFFNLTELRYKVNIHKYITVYLEIIKILDKYHHLLEITNIFHFLNCATVKNYNLEKISLLSDIFLQTINLCIKLSKNMCLDDENMKIRIIKIIITKIETFCNDKDKLLELFYELQEEHKNIFLFFYNNHSILEKFENDIINYCQKTIFLEIVCNNINININYDKRCNYETNCLLLQGLKTSKYDLRACLKYLITLVRLSKYANTITKEEIYNLVSYNNVISLL
ncbi:hypothetical protein CWI36_1439p0010, partial [Hamiltosporidium magnivora]